MQKYSDTVLSTLGTGTTPVAGATITVSNYPSGTAATIYSDNGVTPIGSSTTSDANGRFSFYAADGRYTLTVTATGLVTQTITDVLLEDPVNPSTGTVAVVASVAALKALSGFQLVGNVLVTSATGVLPPDGNGLLYTWNASDVRADNGTTIIQPNAGGTGRWNAVSTNVVTNQQFQFANRFINGAMRIDQRNGGASQTFTAGAAVAYCIDRFYASCTGANVNGQRTAGTTPDEFIYQFGGAASVTQILFGQRIEATNIIDLANTTVTFSCETYNSVLTTVTWTAYYANSKDNWAAKTQIATGTFTVSGTPTRYNAQIALPANAVNGVTIELTVGAQTSGTWSIGQFQLEGNNFMTQFQRRPYGEDLVLCQRYYWRWAPGATGKYFGIGSANASNGGASHYQSPQPMRAIPTMNVSALGDLQFFNWRLGSTATITANNGQNIDQSRGLINFGIGAASYTVNDALGLELLNTAGWIDFSSEI